MIKSLLEYSKCFSVTRFAWFSTASLIGLHGRTQANEFLVRQKARPLFQRLRQRRVSVIVDTMADAIWYGQCPRREATGWEAAEEAAERETR